MVLSQHAALTIGTNSIVSLRLQGNGLETATNDEDGESHALSSEEVAEIQKNLNTVTQQESDQIHHLLTPNALLRT